MSERTWSGEYRYGFNGKERVNEVTVDGESYDFGARVYDARIARMYSLDRKGKLFMGYSPYGYALDNPINKIDLDGNVIAGDVTQFISDVKAAIETVSGADVFLSFLNITTDGSLANISESDFQKALQALGDNPEARAFINGLTQAIRSQNIYEIHYVDDSENLALLIKNENSDARESLLGLFGIDLRGTGIALNNDGAREAETGKGLVGVNAIEGTVAKTYIIVNRSAISEECTNYPQNLDISKSPSEQMVTANPGLSTLNLLFQEFFENDPFIKNKKSSPTTPRIAGFLIENMLRDFGNLPKVSNNTTTLFDKIPPELELPKGKRTKVKKEKVKEKGKKNHNPRFL